MDIFVGWHGSTERPFWDRSGVGQTIWSRLGIIPNGTQSISDRFAKTDPWPRLQNTTKKVQEKLNL